MIGVGIKTRNRRALFERTFRQWRRFMPEGSVCVVVDDASDQPLTGDLDATGGSVYRVIRNDVRMGVAMAQNQLIAALVDAGCEHLFLADDDVFPTQPDWWRPYVESPELHLGYQWPNVGRNPGSRIYDDKHYHVEFPRGVMLYVHRSAVDEVGGFDPAYGAWGGEHVEWQMRIHEAGLTSQPYPDVIGSDKLWAEVRTGSTFPSSRRRRIFECTGIQWQKPRPRFVPYRTDHSDQDFGLGPAIVDTGKPYWALQHAVDLLPSGVAVEFGVGSGTSTRVIARHMPVVGFDSGKGLPEYWRPGFRKYSLAFGIPQVDNASIVEGWFADTLPGYDFDALGYIGLVSFDCDLYSSTATALQYIGPHLRVGTYVYFDEWWGYDGCEAHEQRAWREFADRTGIGWTVVGHGDQQWVIRITGTRGE